MADCVNGVENVYILCKIKIANMWMIIKAIPTLLAVLQTVYAAMYMYFPTVILFGLGPRLPLVLVGLYIAIDLRY
jgi:hypothetical protein